LQQNIKSSTNTFFYFFASCCFIIHSILSIGLGYSKGWGGDEWFSYMDFTWMGLPFSILTKLQIKVLGPLTSDNFLYFKTQGLFWLGVLFLFLTLAYKRSKNKNTRSLIIYLVLFLSLNPFIIEVTQFFRYYSLSLVTCFLVYFYNASNKNIFEKNRFKFYTFLILSPFIHLSIFLQLAGIIFVKEITLLIKNKNWVFKGIFIVLISLILIKIDVIFVFLYKNLMPLYSNHLSYNDIVHRGFGLRTIIKPIHAIFVFLFGIEIAPTEEIPLLLIFIFISLVLSHIVIDQCRNNKTILLDLFLPVVIPFLAIFFILEPISLPGTVQPEPKHGVFLLPMIAHLLFKCNKYRFGKFLNILLFSSFLYSDYRMIKKEYPNWHSVRNLIGSINNPIISDTQANVNLNLPEKNNVIRVNNKNKIKKVLENNDTVIVILENWSNYQILTLNQKWNSAKGTNIGFSIIESLTNNLKENNFNIFDGYSAFPLHCYLFFKDQKTLSHNIPWIYNIKYKDLKIPLYIEGNKIIGFNKFIKGQEILIDSLTYYFIQTNDLSNLNNVIRLKMKNGIEVDLPLDTEKDLHRKYFYRSILENKEVYSFKKSPLVSSSLRHPGSIFNSHGSIYKFSEYSRFNKMRSISKNTNIILAIIENN